MLYSMTGYGDAEEIILDSTYAVEIRTVNNRYLKVSTKLPEQMLYLEDEIEKALRQNLARGTVTYALRQKNVGAAGLVSIDKAVLRKYLEEVAGAAGEIGAKFTLGIGQMLELPEVIASTQMDEQMKVMVREGVLKITAKAMERLVGMRQTEGSALEQVLVQECEAIKEQVDKIKTRSQIVVQEYRAKLRKRVDELLSEAKLTLNEETLAREVAIFADRSDVSEEIARLGSHLWQFVETCRGGDRSGQAGRRLDFISQELLREANTIASKASDSQIIHWVVDIKCRIERLKEQVQNVE